MALHVAHDVGALKLAFDGLDARHLAGARDDGLARARLAVAVRILAGIVDLEADMAMVLDAAHIPSARHKLADRLDDDGRLARIMASDERNRRTWNVQHENLP